MSGVNQSRTRNKILLVEDDPDQLAIRYLILQRQGFICFRATDLPSALLEASQNTPDCVLMDLNIPTEREGSALIEALQTLPHRPVIIILTGRRLSMLRSRPNFQQVDAFIEKGSPTGDLIAALTRACH